MDALGFCGCSSWSNSIHQLLLKPLVLNDLPGTADSCSPATGDKYTIISCNTRTAAARQRAVQPIGTYEHTALVVAEDVNITNC